MDWGRLLFATTAAVVMSSFLTPNTPGFSTPNSVALAAESSARASCHAPPSLLRFTHPLPHTAKRLAAGEPLTIVAIGSSSTAGAGASSSQASYPSRLAQDLEQLFPRARITMLNRGVNGEEARDMIARFASSVIAEKPDLVIWQVGTNAVLRDDPLTPADSLIREGIRELKATGADIVLMDPQFAPKVIAKPEVEGMETLLSTAAKEANINLFARFAIMQSWREKDGLPFSQFVSGDDLHMNDWGYACVAQLLASSIADVTERSIVSAHATVVSH